MASQLNIQQFRREDLQQPARSEMLGGGEQKKPVYSKPIPVEFEKAWQSNKPSGPPPPLPPNIQLKPPLHININQPPPPIPPPSVVVGLMINTPPPNIMQPPPSVAPSQVSPQQSGQWHSNNINPKYNTNNQNPNTFQPNLGKSGVGNQSFNSIGKQTVL